MIQLSDLLDYENAQIAHLNRKSLFRIAAESKDENSKIRKILTVITLIYLPVTVVAVGKWPQINCTCTNNLLPEHFLQSNHSC